MYMIQPKGLTHKEIITLEGFLIKANNIQIIHILTMAQKENKNRFDLR